MCTTDLLKAYFKNTKKIDEKEEIFYYLRKGGIEKSFPCDHLLPSLGKPRDAKR